MYAYNLNPKFQCARYAFQYVHCNTEMCYVEGTSLQLSSFLPVSRGFQTKENTKTRINSISIGNGIFSYSSYKAGYGWYVIYSYFTIILKLIVFTSLVINRE